LRAYVNTSKYGELAYNVPLDPLAGFGEGMEGRRMEGMGREAKGGKKEGRVRKGRGKVGPPKQKSWLRS